MSHRLRQARRQALRILYASDVSGIDADESLDNARQTLSDDAQYVDDEFWTLVADRVRGVDEHSDAIDDEIRRLSPNWRIHRMAAVDRNLLRLGIYEILHDVTPPLITINACVELAKEFGTSTTPGFINGLLDQLCQDHDIPIESSS